MKPIFAFESLPEKATYNAPDKSEIRKLIEFDEGNIAHCRLPVGQTSDAVKHKTVKELWYCLSGKGKMWQQTQDGIGCVKEIKQGDALSIPLGNSFQFQNTGDIPLEFLLCTMPKWPEGVEEAIPVDALVDKGFEGC